MNTRPSNFGIALERAIVQAKSRNIRMVVVPDAADTFTVVSEADAKYSLLPQRFYYTVYPDTSVIRHGG